MSGEGVARGTSDPFGALASPLEPVVPDAGFALRLRTRVKTALSLPRGVEPMTDTALTDTAMTDTAMTDTAMAETPTTRSSVGPAGFPRPGAVPYLAVADARAAIAWYVDAFGAVLAGEPYVMDDDRIGHAELVMGGGTIYLADAFDELGYTAPEPGRTPVSLMLPVDDTDAVLERVRAAGGRVEREPYDDYGQRNASLYDPFGHRWMLAGPAPGAPDPDVEPIRHGDVGYASWWSPDMEKAARFYADVLGWEYAEHEPGSPGRRITNLSQPRGLWQDDSVETGAGTLLLAYAVDNLEAAVRAVREAGGQAQDPVTEERRVVAHCADDQGLRFFLYAPEPGEVRPAANGSVPGDLGYITMEVRDSDRARAFYDAVLGYGSSEGSVEDGWQIDEARPMTGMAGGRAGAVVPMWKVTDVAAAIRRVRAAGGTAGEPDQRPYGMLADCHDDQGAHFYLGDT